MHRRIAWLVILSLVVSLFVRPDGSVNAQDQGRFVRLWWYEPGIEHGNPVTNRRFRVNAPEAVLHPQFALRSETKSSGMLQILMPEKLPEISGAELALELWGGHPGTANRRVTLNGRTTYPLPGPKDEHCSHAYPVIPLKRTDLVEGHNAIQFACDQGTTFWGHFIVEQACLRAELPASHPDLKQAGLDGFSARVRATPTPLAEEMVPYRLEVPAQFADKVARVDFEAFYDGYDENGDGVTRDWHGFTKARQPVAWMGAADTPPYEVKWKFDMLPEQVNMQVRAVVHFREPANLRYITQERTGIANPLPAGKSVRLYTSKDLPAPFWSRAGRLKTCTIQLDVDPARIERAELHTVVWDGGAGTVEKYFTLNGHPLAVAGSGKHDVIYTRLPLDPAWLRQGENRIELSSDTEHHGIEVLLPGPAIMVRWTKPKP